MQQTTFFPFTGGENLSQPAITLQPGELLASSNYYCVTTGGYRRIDGYERFDGQSAPSEATFTILHFEQGTLQFIEGDVITGSNSGAQAQVIGMEMEYGEFTTGDATGVLYIANRTGIFEDLEGLQVGATTAATCTGQFNSTDSDDLNDEILQSAIEYLRDKIDPLPGSGPVRGVAYYKDTVYAFRDNEGATACVMYKSTPTGWQVVTTPTLNPGGKYEFTQYNFTGSSLNKKLYGVSGVNKAFEFDGATYTEITTGMVDDRPNHLAAFKRYLFLSFPGGSLQNSPLADPTSTWTPLTGANEIATGDEIVGLMSMPGDTLVVFNRNRTYLLQGASPDTWNLVEFSDESGAIESSIQRIGGGMYLDDRGLTTLNAVQAYGDFNASTISQKVNKKLLALTKQVKASVRVKSKDQYILYFGNGQGVCVTYTGEQLIGITSLNYTHTVNVIYAGESSAGEERIFFGSDNGFVYELNKGASFDGEPVVSTLRFAFNHVGSPAFNKRFYKVLLEIEGGKKVSIKFSTDYSYGSLELPVTLEQDFTVRGGGGYWDVGNWDEIIWDGQPIATAEAYVNGVGKNMSLYIYCSQTYETPHTLQGAIIHYSGRGLNR